MFKIIFLLILFLSFTIMISATEVLIVSGEYSPLVSETLPGNGVIAEIISEAFSRIPDFNVKYDFYPWKRVEAFVESGNAWGAFPYSRTAERIEKYLFSDIIFQSEMVFFNYDQDSDIEYKILSDLKTYTIGGVSGYYYEKQFKVADLEVLYSSKETLAIKNLIAGRVDLVPMMDIIGWTIIMEDFPHNYQKFDTLQNPFDITTSSIMVSKTYPDSEKILKAFNEALNSMKKDGTYQEYLDKIKEQFILFQSKE